MGMNKQELAKKIKETEESLAKMREELEKPEKFELWKPEEGEVGYYIGPTMEAEKSTYWTSSVDTKVIKGHNVIKTRSQATRRVRWLKAYNELLSLAEQLNGDWVPDWGDGRHYKYYIERFEGRFEVSDNLRLHRIGAVYFKSKETAQLALDTLSEESKEVLSKGYY